MSTNKNLVDNIQEDLFIKTIKESFGWTNACKKLNINPDNRHLVKNRAKNLNIDHIHKICNITEDELRKAVEISDSFIELMERTKKSRRYIQKMLIKYNISIDNFKQIHSKNIKQDITEEVMKNYVLGCKSLKEILLKMKLSESKENYIWLRDTCKNMNINLMRLKRIDWKLINIENINEMMENKPSGPHLKSGLLKSGLKPDKCEICGQEPVHNNIPLVLQLHHIDGNNKNNKLENIQILCPNCHTQTETYARSIKRQRKLQKK